MEGAEAEVVPALVPLLRRARPAVLVDLHPAVLSPRRIDAVLRALRDVYPSVEVTESVRALAVTIQVRRYRYRTYTHFGWTALAVQFWVSKIAVPLYSSLS